MRRKWCELVVCVPAVCVPGCLLISLRLFFHLISLLIAHFKVFLFKLFLHFAHRRPALSFHYVCQQILYGEFLRLLLPRAPACSRKTYVPFKAYICCMRRCGIYRVDRNISIIINISMLPRPLRLDSWFSASGIRSSPSSSSSSSFMPCTH